MTSNDIKISNLDIVKPSTPPSAPTNEIVLELVPTTTINGLSEEEEMMIPNFNSQSKQKKKTSKKSSAASSSTSKRPSIEIMTPNNIKIIIDSKLDDIVKLFTPPSVPTNEIVLELVPRTTIDGLSEEKIMIPVSNSQSEIMETSEDGSAASSPMSERSSKEEGWSIPKVPHRLRKKKKAYEPNVISIGPYHYRKKHLRAMDDVKRSCFAEIVQRTQLELKEFVNFMEHLEERALDCYQRPFRAKLESGDKFREMMVYDGCFIVQLIRNPLVFPKLPRHILNGMWDDLLLVDNQLPFFVLLKLDQIIMGNDVVKFEKKALSSFVESDAYTLNIFPKKIPETNSSDHIKHLLDMVHKCYCPSPQGIVQQNKYSTKEANGSIRSGKFICNASELNNARIDFAGVENSFLDVTFTKYTDIIRLKILKKVLKIPTLCVRKNTERRLRNLMAYELFTPESKPTYVSDYVVLMDNLIDTGKDVQLLCTSGVIESRLPDDEAVAQMFNELGDSTYSKQNFYYAEIVDKVNQHCEENTRLAKWNKSIANLKKDYFSSPWTVCSLLAAVILLVATLLQTAYALISYYHPSSTNSPPELLSPHR